MATATKLTKRAFYSEINSRSKMLFASGYLGDNAYIEYIEEKADTLRPTMAKTKKTRQLHKVKSFGLQLATETGDISELRHETGDKYYMLDSILIAISNSCNSVCLYL